MKVERLPAWERTIIESVPDSSRWEIRCFNSGDSTMGMARELLSDLDRNQAAAVLFEQQLAGKGRQGRIWKSAGKGFAATFVFRGADSYESVAGLSIFVGCLIRRALSKFGIETLLKWPNDILSQDYRKLVGVLIELLEREGEIWVLAGIGINLAGAPEEYNAVALDQLGLPEITQVEIAAELISQIDLEWKNFLRAGLKPYLTEFLEHAAYLNQQITLKLGNDIVTGSYTGIDSSGELLLETQGGLKRITSGHFLESQDATRS